MTAQIGLSMRPLGASGLFVTRLGLGMAALGRPGYMTLGHGGDLGFAYDLTSMESHAHAVLDAAWNVGIRYFDAARSYGRAEVFLNSWLTTRGHKSDTVIVGSKWGYTYTAEWQVQAEKHEVKDLSVDVLRRQWDETQTALLGCVNLYQVHSATLESGVLSDAAVLGALAQLKQSGVRVGLTLSGTQQVATLEQARKAKVDGVAVFDVVQATWNLLERSAGAALADAHAQGMGVIVKEALANGRLTTRNNAQEFAESRALLEIQATRLKTSVDALAIAGVLAQPWADVVLSGAATEAQIQSNAQSIGVPWDEEAAATLAVLREEPGIYWATRCAMKWN